MGKYCFLVQHLLLHTSQAATSSLSQGQDSGSVSHLAWPSPATCIHLPPNTLVRFPSCSTLTLQALAALLTLVTCINITNPSIFFKRSTKNTPKQLSSLKIKTVSHCQANSVQHQLLPVAHFHSWLEDERLPLHPGQRYS